VNLSDRKKASTISWLMDMAFLDDLHRFGPGAPYRVSRDQALDYCAKLTAAHYENFSVVTWLTPPRHRSAFRSIYAFCRWSDDLGDEIGDKARSLELLGWWRGELRSLYRGEARHPVMIALGETVRKYGIPIDPFDALISAFEQDQTVSEYDTYEQLLEYCGRSANPVGHLVLYVAGAFTPENARLADATCTALQLTNFWQDVARDLAIGRIYLPRADRERFHYPESDLRALRFTPQFAEMMKFQVERARRLFAAGRELLVRVPLELAVDIDLFSRGGLAILDRIEAQGFDVLGFRPVLTRWNKVALLWRALGLRVLLALGRIRRHQGVDRVADAPSSHPEPASPRFEGRP
jgi:squalene synthase HpnC